MGNRKKEKCRPLRSCGIPYAILTSAFVITCTSLSPPNTATRNSADAGVRFKKCTSLCSSVAYVRAAALYVLSSSEVEFVVVLREVERVEPRCMGEGL